MKDAPLDCVSSGWKRYVVPSDQAPDRRYYTLCVLSRLFVALRRRDIYVPQSSRWGDPRAKLLQGEAWERVRATVCQSLGCSPTAASELETLTTRLDDAYLNSMYGQVFSPISFISVSTKVAWRIYPSASALL